ncbi:MAG: hypothetical protein KBS54_00770 [Synergistaceae bacterium]|nr:hypothetical protein [Candidatus Equadaptatus faecalis]
MTEEQVTKALIKWLLLNKWDIVCFDFPQSGTGHFLHPNGTKEKMKDSINPDIVAVKDDICVFFENKGYFYFNDFKKVNFLRSTDIYSEAIQSLLNKYVIHNIYYGIGYPKTAHKAKAIKSVHLVDFILGINEDFSVEILYDEGNLF